jgi:HprK-related kinase B
VQDVDGGRLIRKVATGVVMGLWPGHAFAVGDVRTHLNQAINLVNACYAKVVLRRGHLLLHASAVAREGRAVALAGPPGAGKSTAALHLVEQGLQFVSNDRVLAKPLPDAAEVLGYPKQPRVNPGTVLHHPRLAGMLKPDERDALLALPTDQLWALERKCDVDLGALYGADVLVLQAMMSMLVVLRWRPGRDERPSFRRLGDDALARVTPLIEKDLGVFGPGLEAAGANREVYVDLMRRVPVHEASGGMDLRALEALVRAEVARALSG